MMTLMGLHKIEHDFSGKTRTPEHDLEGGIKQEHMTLKAIKQEHMTLKADKTTERNFVEEHDLQNGSGNRGSPCRQTKQKSKITQLQQSNREQFGI
jgi:hypothetical protein